MMNKKIIKNKNGFTLIEALLASALVALLGYGATKMFLDGVKVWNNGSVRLALYSEARICMIALTKFVHSAQGSTIRISRYDNNQPANSLISGILTEALYVKTTTGLCCGSGSDVTTVGSSNNPNKNHTYIYQQDNKLILSYPYLVPGTDIRNKNAVDANTYPKYVTLSTNLESLIITYDDSRKDKTILISARFAKTGFKNEIIRVNLNQAVSVKRMHTTGYYAN
jgi:hypothetical protein